MIKRIIPLLLFSAIGIMTACKHEPYKLNPNTPSTEGSNFPTAVAKIFVTKCATSGCHNALSYQNANGLLLDTWDHLFDGGNNGAAVVAYDIENSPLLQFVNTDPTLGPVASPTMPQQVPGVTNPPLTREEYITLRDWIANGAPDKDGNIPFASNAASRQKIYISQQGCDLVAVIDAQKKVVMRYIHVGKTADNEQPHCVRIAPDGQYGCTSFLSGQYIQKFDTRTDAITSELNVGVGSWNVFELTPTNTMMLSNWDGNGAVLQINTASQSIVEQYKGSNLFVYPHGIASSIKYDTFYITSNYGNVVYKISPLNGYYERVSIDNDVPVTNPPQSSPHKLDPHEIMMTPDHSKYFLTCENSNEVRVMDAYEDTLIKVFKVGVKPQEIALSRNKPYMFVTCMEDTSLLPGYKGSVYVFDYNTLSLVRRIDGKFYQPHGITVDDQNGVFYVVSRNSNPLGPAPHHSSGCGGRNGWYNIYDLNTLQPFDNKRYEVSVEPYSADVRFK